MPEAKGTLEAHLLPRNHLSDVILLERFGWGQGRKVRSPPPQHPTAQQCLKALVLVSDKDRIKGMFLQIHKLSPNPKVQVSLAFGRQQDVSAFKPEFLPQGHQVIAES